HGDSGDCARHIYRSYSRSRLRLSFVESEEMTEFDFQPRTRVVFGSGSLEQLPGVARDLAFTSVLLVADAGLVAAGHVATVAGLLKGAGIEVHAFHKFGPNPDTEMVAAGQAFANGHRWNGVVALGGGSSMDIAKAINLESRNPGFIQ